MPKSTISSHVFWISEIFEGKVTLDHKTGKFYLLEFLDTFQYKKNWFREFFQEVQRLRDSWFCQKV
jgi:hypothetical protein